MMKAKKVLLGAAVLSCAIAAGAQTSNAAVSSAGLFGTEVDDFMGVNDWSGVEADNFFGFLGYDAGVFNLGAAKNFGKKGKYYGALYAKGPLGINFLNTTASAAEKGSVTSGGTTTETNTATSASATGSQDLTGFGNLFDSDINVTNDFTVAALFGTGDIGAKLTLEYVQEDTDITAKDKYKDKVTETNNESSKVINKHATYTPTLEGGYNVKVGKYTLKNSASFGLVIAEDHDYSYTFDADADPKETTAEAYNTSFTYKIAAGTAVVFPEQKGFHQVVSGNLETGFKYIDKTDASNTVDEKNWTKNITKHYNNEFVFTPAYKVTYDKVDNLNVGLKVTVPVTFAFASDVQRLTSNTNAAGYTTVVNSKNTTGSASMNIDEAALALGFTYDVAPSKFAIHAGANLGLPSFKSETIYSNGSTSTKVTNDADGSTAGEGKGKSKASATATQGITADAQFALSSGFTWTIAKTIKLDCSYNVLGDLLNATLNSKWTSGAGTSIWNNANLVLFHDLALQLSVKL